MLADLQEQGDENTALERKSYVETKADLLMKLTDARAKEKERQRGCVSDEEELRIIFIYIVPVPMRFLLRVNPCF
jgi:hypothetical protein